MTTSANDESSKNILVSGGDSWALQPRSQSYFVGVLPRPNEKYQLVASLDEAFERSVVDSQLEKLSKRWLKEVAFLSNPADIRANPCFQEIVALGPLVVPYARKHLPHFPMHWSWVLEVIVGVNPVAPADYGVSRHMVNAWEAYLRAQGYDRLR